MEWFPWAIRVRSRQWVLGAVVVLSLLLAAGDPTTLSGWEYVAAFLLGALGIGIIEKWGAFWAGPAVVECRLRGDREFAMSFAEYLRVKGRLAAADEIELWWHLYE